MPEAIRGAAAAADCRCLAAHALLDWSVIEDGTVGVLRFLGADGGDVTIGFSMPSVPRLVMALMEMGNEAARQRALGSQAGGTAAAAAGCRLLALAGQGGNAAFIVGCHALTRPAAAVGPGRRD